MPLPRKKIQASPSPDSTGILSFVSLLVGDNSVVSLQEIGVVMSFIRFLIYKKTTRLTRHISFMSQVFYASHIAIVEVMYSCSYSCSLLASLPSISSGGFYTLIE